MFLIHAYKFIGSRGLKSNLTSFPQESSSNASGVLIQAFIGLIGAVRNWLMQ